jgi:glycosidase
MNFRFITILALAIYFFSSCGNDDTIISDDGNIADTLKGPKQYGEPFDKIPETRDINMYEVNPMVFSAAGDLDGVTERLDSIKKLGINVVWLMPIYPTGDVKSVGSPYAINVYDKVKKEKGTLDDLRNLVEKAHELEMAVILDWVANHTAWDHHWLTNKDWYTQNSSGAVIHPPGTEWKDVADLNFENQEMRAEMIKMMKYWVLEANVDGYRCDYAHGVPGDFWQQAIDTLRSIPNREIIMFAETEDKDLADAGFDLIFGWPYYTAIKNVFNGEKASGLFSKHRNEYGALDNDKHIVRWISNHDESAWNTTPQNAFGGQNAALAAFAITAYMGGVPLVYNGQEVGISQQIPFFEGSNYKINWNQNPHISRKYNRILNFRNESEIIRKKSLQDWSNDDVICFSKKEGENYVLVLANTRASSSEISIPEELIGKNWVHAFNKNAYTLKYEMALGSYELIVLESR